MNRYVVLLRGVNVGKGKRVPMADFSALLADLGCRDVKTLLNSGNAVCSSSVRSGAKLAAAVKAALVDRLAVETPVIVVSGAELDVVIAENPLAAACTEASRLLVAFPQQPEALPDLAELASRVSPPERFVVGAHAAYLWCPNGILQSQVGEALLGKAGRLVTTRNWATVLKLQTLVRAVS